MSYNRVIPRDLFNESSLLKCLGRLYICLENTPGHAAELQQVGREFDIRQSDDDGSIYAAGAADDRQAFTRLYVANRISLAAANEAWRKGVRFAEFIRKREGGAA